MRFPFILLLFLFFVAQSQGQASKIIHQTFTLDGAEKININVVGARVEIKETRGSRILIETHISISMPNERLLDYVANGGRYDLIKELDVSKNELIISSKKTNNVLVIRGEECYEEVSYVFYLPIAVRYANNSTISTLSKE